MQIVTNVYLAILRIVAPVLASVIVLRCAWPMLTFRREPEIWGWLIMPDGTQITITHWENLIGRSKNCDLVLEFPTVSRNHAVLTRYDDGSWTICDAGSKTGLSLNGQPIQIAALSDQDQIQIGGIPLTFQPATAQQELDHAQLRTRAANGWRSIANVALLTIFEVFVCVGFLVTGADKERMIVAWGGLMALQWMLLLFYFSIHRPAFEAETIAFFLCALGMAVISAVAPGETMKQLIAIALGLGLFLLIGWTLRDLERTKKIRYLAAVVGMVLLIVTLLFGQEYYGAKNWLMIGSLSVQPSEFSKICFVYVGASTLDRLVQKRNLVLFIAYTVALCGFLALMNDFGTALVFFCAFLMIAYLRSGSLGTVALACTALLFAAIIGLQIAPHALRRLQTWRHIWEDTWGAGYQQTQALMCIASGGLFGLGVGQGKMKHLFASDSDMVFATISEEWGLLLAALATVCIVVLALFSLRCAAGSRSSFYAISSCTAVGILLVQTILNVLGTVDALPLTGVTFPLLSNGGSSMLSVWGLLGFIKAGDTRQNGSFAVKVGHRRNDYE